MSWKINEYGLVLIILNTIVLTGCKDKEENVMDSMGDELYQSEVEQSEEYQIKKFLKIYSSALENSDFEKVLEMWDATYDWDVKEKQEEIPNLKEDIIPLKFNLELIEVVDSAAYEEDRYIYMQVLTKAEFSMIDSEENRAYKGLAHAYIAKVPEAKYGYLIEDDLEFLDD